MYSEDVRFCWEHGNGSGSKMLHTTVARLTLYMYVYISIVVVVVY